MTGTLIKHGLLQLFPLAYFGSSGVTPPHLYFQSACLGAVLNMAVNNLLLRWTMHEGNKYGVELWSCIKVKYESAAKLVPLGSFYGEKIRFLKLKSGGLFGNYIK